MPGILSLGTPLLIRIPAALGGFTVQKEGNESPEVEGGPRGSRQLLPSPQRGSAGGQGLGPRQGNCRLQGSEQTATARMEPFIAPRQTGGDDGDHAKKGHSDGADRWVFSTLFRDAYLVSSDFTSLEEDEARETRRESLSGP